MLFEILYSHNQENPEPREEEKSPKSLPPDYEPASPLTPIQLLTLMNVHHLRALDDERAIIRRGHSLDSNAVSHAATMFQMPKVKQLMHSSVSGVVLVNGCSDRSQTQVLRREGRNVVLGFFCGQHSASNDDLGGPQGLMRSLVAFLVLGMVQNKYIPESESIWFSNFQGRDFEELSFRDICQLFYHLIELVPKGTPIYCVIDGISYYERPHWKEDYDLMMECFGSIITNKGISATFKLLLTSPTISRWLQALLAREEIVSLRNTRTRGQASPESLLQSTSWDISAQGNW
jgi:hypothetical protein